MSILNRIISEALRGSSDRKHEEFVAQVRCVVPPQEFDEHKHLLDVLRPDSEWPVDHRAEFLSLLFSGVSLREAFGILDEVIVIGQQLGISSSEALQKLQELESSFGGVLVNRSIEPINRNQYGPSPIVAFAKQMQVVDEIAKIKGYRNVIEWGRPKTDSPNQSEAPDTE